MGVEGPSSSDKIRQFPPSPGFLRESKQLVAEARKTIEEKYSSFYFGSIVASGDVPASRDRSAEREVLEHAKAMCDELEEANAALEVDKTDNVKLEVAKDAKESLERALDTLKSFA